MQKKGGKNRKEKEKVDQINGGTLSLNTIKGELGKEFDFYPYSKFLRFSVKCKGP